MVNRKKRQKSVAGKALGVEASNKEGTKGEVEIVEMAKTPVKKRKRGADREMVESFFLSLDVESSILHRRKDTPSFRMVLLRENDLDRIVGKRIKVLWPDSKKWFAGQIKSFNIENKLHSIVYDDGDKEQLNLIREQFELEILPSEAFTILSQYEPYPEIPGDGGGSGDAVNEGLLMMDRSETVDKKMKQSMSSRGQEGSSKQQIVEDSEMMEDDTMAADMQVDRLPGKSDRVKIAETNTLQKQESSEPVKRVIAMNRKPSKDANKRRTKRQDRKITEEEGNMALDTDDRLREKIEHKMVDW
ncbi:DNA mismatch repair protein MSH6-like isoform X1 [Macadamia integrifolia]|uniref:DNA mismatch repair protein MSH6-like isoform X1 n=1 Tax=Macadamia integrifolia TaxID=60698 RepID=UPI001C4EF1DD|nr:DNA mismatch repair protein MSH6-like isoform X1 [Macadamia integrifolia]XP_042484117.1 DNA mismatch repair protein MSH6-like isoform X1 [Macadamia integrifolia]